MKTWLRFRSTSIASLWYVTLVVLVPVVSLVVLGIVYLLTQGWLLQVLGVWLLVTLLAYGLFAVNRKKREAMLQQQLQKSGARDEPRESLPEVVPTPVDWSEDDLLHWDSAKLDIEKGLAENPDWQHLPEFALQLVSGIAAQYHGDGKGAEFRFTLPEGLLLMSVASRRYRQLLLHHVPFADEITIATVLSLHQRQGTIRRGATWANRARRVFRLTNPAVAAIGELRDQFTDRVFAQVTVSLQRDLQRLALQEIAQVAIDLYSGRLKVSSDELDVFSSTALIEDAQRQAEPVEPLRVVLIGQSGAGKSSLINALIEDVAAEVDVLPTTDQTTVHVVRRQREDAEALLIHLIDTEGLDGRVQQQAEVVKTCLAADLILLVSRATQPARAVDLECLQLIDEVFVEHPRRRKPPMLVAVTHVDTLPPRDHWEPPYRLDTEDSDAEGSNAGGDALGNLRAQKGGTIAAALNSTRAQLELRDTTPLVPVCSDPLRGVYNIDVIAEELEQLSEVAAHTQLNRRRVELTQQDPGWSGQWQRVRRLGRVLGDSMIMSRFRRRK